MSHKATEKLIENVSKYPANLSAAFRLTARQTGHTPAAISQLYYGNKKREGVRDTHPMFMLQTQEGLTINTKRVGVKRETKRTLKLNSEMLSLQGLSTEEKASVFDMMFSNK